MNVLKDLTVVLIIAQTLPQTTHVPATLATDWQVMDVAVMVS